MDQNPAGKVFSYRWLIFGIMAVAYVFVYFHRLSPAVVAVDLQKTFETSGGLMGLLASAYFYPYAFMQLPAGLLADSLGPRKTVTAFLVIAAAGSLIFGLAPALDVAIAARVMVGLGVWIREFAFMTAILTTMGGMGALVAATPLALMTGWVGWRQSFEMIAAGTFLMAILVWLFVRNRPQDMGWPSVAEIDHLGPGASAPPIVITLWEGARRVITERHFWPVAVWFFFICGIFFSFGGLWAGPYLMHVYGMTRSEVGHILNMIAVGIIIGSPLVSFLSDRVFHSRKKVLMLASAVMFLELVWLNVFPQDIPRLWLYVVFLIFSISSSAIVVIGFTTTKELFPVEIVGTSVGTVNLFPFLGGAVFQPIVGRLLEAYPKAASGAYSIDGYRAMLMLLLGMSIIVVASTFFMKETFPGWTFRK
jgi:sugar phosphate permease